MPTSSEAAKRRWDSMTPAEQLRWREKGKKTQKVRREARILAAHLRAVNAAGGFRKAIETVKAAGILLEAAS